MSILRIGNKLLAWNGNLLRMPDSTPNGAVTYTTKAVTYKGKIVTYIRSLI